MGYRTFRDSKGADWHAWDVVPRLEERRVNDRRTRPAAPPHSDRRATDRRVLSGPRGVLSSGYRQGWLCFETDAEKRRLTPIPPDWSRCAVERLEQYCAHATSARRISTNSLSSPLTT